MSGPHHEEPNTDFTSDLFPRVVSNPRLEDANSSRLHRSASRYGMDQERRGYAAIFIQVGCENERSFVANDIASLCNTFIGLGFETETYSDLTFGELQTVLEELGQRDQSDCDCFVLVYLSGGAEGKLRAKDRCFDVNCLWGCFTAEQSPTLANKPKVFIVQAYKDTYGSRKKVSFSVNCAVVEDSDDLHVGPTDDLRSYYIPDRADFLIILSPVQEMVSFGRGKRLSSLYIQTLCSHLGHLGFHEDILTILTEVNNQTLKLANERLKSCCDSCKRKMPTTVNLLIRILQFTEKNKESCVKRKRSDSRDLSKDKGYGRIEEDSASQENLNKRKKLSNVSDQKRRNQNKLSGAKTKKGRNKNE